MITNVRIDKLSSKLYCICSIFLPAGSFFLYGFFDSCAVVKKRKHKRQLSSTVGRSLTHAVSFFLFTIDDKKKKKEANLYVRCCKLFAFYSWCTGEKERRTNGRTTTKTIVSNVHTVDSKLYASLLCSYRYNNDDELIV